MKKVCSINSWSYRRGWKLRRKRIKRSGTRAGGKVIRENISRGGSGTQVREGVYEHRVEEIGTPRGAYVTRHRLDFEVKTVATEIRIYADAEGKFQIPEG